MNRCPPRCTTDLGEPLGQCARIANHPGPCWVWNESPGTPCRWCGKPVPGRDGCPDCWTDVRDNPHALDELYEEAWLGADGLRSQA